LKQQIRWMMVLATAVLATRLAALVVPFFFNGDEATYSALATRLLAGFQPYKGAVDHKPPAIMALYALVFEMTGRNRILPVRILLLGAIWVTGWVLSTLGQRLTDRSAGRLAGIYYVVASSWGLPGDTQAANTELFLNLFLCLSAMWVASSTLSPNPRGTGALLMAGALTAVASMFKYQAALAGLGWAWTAWSTGGSVPRRIWKLACLAVGFLVVAVAWLVYLRWKGIWDDYLFWGWSYNASYIVSMPGRILVTRAAGQTAIMGAFWIPLLLLIRRPVGKAPALVLPWLGTMGLSVAIGGRFTLHYYLMMLPPLCLLAVLGTAVIPSWRLKTARVLGVAVSLASIALSWCWDRVKPDLRQQEERYRAVATFLQERSSPEDRLFVWGNSAEIYYYADRVMGTRFPFCNYHAGKIWGTPADDVSAADTEAFQVPRAWSDLFADLDQDPPRFLVDGGAGRLDRFDLHPIARYPDLARRVHERYRLVGEPAGVPVYERNDGLEGTR